MSRKHIKRDILVCLDKGCTECDIIDGVVPPGCKFEILHALGKRTGGIQDRKRQSGKTIELVSIANLLAERGERVYFVSRNYDMGQYAKRRTGLNSTVEVVPLTYITYGRIYRNYPAAYLILDEVSPEEMDMVKMAFGNCPIVAAYYSSAG